MKKFVSGALKTFLLGAPGQMIVADCLTLTLVTGQVFRLTTFDFAVTIAANATLNQPGGTFSAMGSRLTRGKIESKRGFETPQTEFIIAPTVDPDLSGGVVANPPSQVLGLSLIQAADAGLLYGATVRLETVYGDPSSGGGLTRNPDGTYNDGGWGSLIKFVGLVADIETTKTHLTITAVPTTHLLEPLWPGMILQPSCRWRLFDSGCRLSAASFAVTGTVVAGSTIQVVQTNLTNPAGYFNLGRIVFTSGQNNGLSRSIQASIGAGAGAGYAATVLADGPYLYFKLNDVFGSTTLADSSGNGFSATVHGGVTLGQASMLPGDPSDTAALFNGTNGYLTVNAPKPAGLNSTGGTFEFWFKLTSGAGADQPRGIFDSNAGTFASGILRNNGQPNDTLPGFEWGFDRPYIGIVPPTPGTAVHVVLVFRGARSLDLYINGNLYDSQTKAALALFAWANPFWVGQTGGAHFFNGTLQHFAVYNYPFSASQALTHYLVGSSAPTTGSANGVLGLLTPLIYAPAAGDTFTAYPGCDKTQHTCTVKFNNVINFGGFPYVPQPEQGI